MAHRRGAVGRRMVRRKGALVWVTDLGNALLNVGTAQAFFIAEGLDWQRGSGQTISSGVFVGVAESLRHIVK